MAINDRLDYVKMKARHQKQLLPWYKKGWGILIIVVISLIIILLTLSVFYVFNEIENIKLTEEEKDIKIMTDNYYKAIKGDGSNYYLGAPKKTTGENDKTEVLEITTFSNFACYFSSLSSPIIKDLANKYGNRVRFIYRDYPDPNSIVLSLAARCAGEQNKFWEMHDFLFELQDEFSSIVDEEEKRFALLEMADMVGLNVDSFTNCLDSKKYLTKVRRDYEDGEFLEIPGTPTWFVNGVKIVGGLNEAKFKELLLGLGYTN